MAVKTKQIEGSQAQAAENKGEVAVIEAPRLPYHPLMAERFGVDRSSWRTLIDVIFPSARSTDSVVLALSYCKARNLDVFKRPIHIVPMYSTALKKYVETIWPGISELRTTAFRTGQYAGMEEAEWGPMMEGSFTGMVGYQDKQREITVTLKYPQWCRIAVLRELNGKTCRFVGPKVVWLEQYAAQGASDVPNKMWEERPEGQLEKCAEAAALRRAFPEELGNDLTAEEMEGRRIAGSVAAAATTLPGPPPPPETHKVKSSGPPPPPTTARGEPVTHDEDGVVLDDPHAPGSNGIPKSLDRTRSDSAEWLRNLEGALGGCEEIDGINDTVERLMTPHRKDAFPPDWSAAQTLVRQAIDRVNTTIIDAG